MRPPVDCLHFGDRGPHVVLVHGAGLGAQVWRRLGVTLAGLGYRVDAPNLCGYGATPVPADFGVADDVSILASLCDEGSLVLGHSYGGAVALRLARTQRFARLVLYEPAAFDLLADGESEAQAELGRDPRFWDPARGGDEAWMRAFVDFWTEPGGFDALPSKARAAQLAVGPRAFANVRATHLDPTTLADYAAVATPTTLVWGAETRRDAKLIARRLAATLPQATTAEIAGAGHMGPLTHPREILAILTGP